MSLVIAVAGAALDMGTAVKAVSKLGQAAIEAGGDLVKFTQVVEGAGKGEGDRRPRSPWPPRRRQRTRKGFAEASSELTKVMTGKKVLGSLADPDVYKAVVNMARRRSGPR